MDDISLMLNDVLKNTYFVCVYTSYGSFYYSSFGNHPKYPYPKFCGCEICNFLTPFALQSQNINPFSPKSFNVCKQGMLNLVSELK